MAEGIAVYAGLALRYLDGNRYRDGSR
jgi:hypothetical protein